MPEGLLPPSLAVVVLGLLASAGWGISDFGGGFASRKAPVVAVLARSQLAGLVIALPLLVARGEPAMTPADLAIATTGGLFAAIGLGLLYRGLSAGRMGVVAPIAGVLTAAVPVGFGLATQGVPPPGAILGIGLAVVSVVLVSRVPDELGSPASAGRQPSALSGVLYGLAAGVGFGLFAVMASQLSDGLVVGPVVVIRAVSVTLVTGFALLTRRPFGLPGGLWPVMIGIGAVDMLATTFYLAAIEVGPLAIAAILAALYPVVTVLLAAIVLRERFSWGHGLGVALAGVAIALITGATG